MMKAAGEPGESASMPREAAKTGRPGSETARMPQRSIMRPRIGVARALSKVARDSANETVERCKWMSAEIGLRNPPEVKNRTGPLHTVSPATAPATPRHGLANRATLAG